MLVISGGVLGAIILQALTGLIHAHADMAMAHQAAILVILRERDVFSAENWDIIRRQRADIEQMFSQVVAQGQLAGDFGLVGDSRLIALAIYGMINWSSEWYRTRHDDPFPAPTCTLFKFTP